MVGVEQFDRSEPEPSFCAICGKAVRSNPIKTTDSDVVCRDCRCVHCSIPLSSKTCRCGTAHGRASKIPGWCERCYTSVGSRRQAELSVPEVFAGGTAELIVSGPMVDPEMAADPGESAFDDDSAGEPETTMVAGLTDVRGKEVQAAAGL